MHKTLVDTDVLSYFLKGHAYTVNRVERYLAEHGRLNISIITYYEVLSGLKHRDLDGRIGAFLAIVEANNLLPLSAQACEHAAIAYAQLRKAGTPVDDIDLLIAGIAAEHGLSVATRNVRHFARIPGLRVEDWATTPE